MQPWKSCLLNEPRSQETKNSCSANLENSKDFAFLVLINPIRGDESLHRDRIWRKVFLCLPFTNLKSLFQTPTDCYTGSPDRGRDVLSSDEDSGSANSCQGYSEKWAAFRPVKGRNGPYPPGF